MQTQSCRSLLRGLWMPVALLAGGLLAPSAHAQTSVPRAGTSIGNKASATYTDNANVSRSTQSNTVSTVVTQVPAVDLTDDRKVRAYPSAPVNFAHTVTNTGNGPDSFSLTAVYLSGINVSPLSVYADSNGDGIADSNTVITRTPTLQPGESFNFVVTGRVPDGAAQDATGTIRVTSTSVANTGISDFNDDTVTVSTNANIVLRKSVSKDSGTPSDTTQYTYTLSYVNNSQFTAGETVITDIIPAQLKYVAGSGVWQGTPLTDATGNVDATITNSDGTTSTMNYSVTGQNLNATISRIPPGQGTITFKFTVPNGTAPGIARNTAQISYDDDNVPATTAITDKSNTVPFTISPVTSFTFTGPTAVPSAAQGATIPFNNTLTNTGTGTDTFDITVVNPTSNGFPEGTTFQLFKSDGQTPLLDTNGNNIPDTGPVPARNTANGVSGQYVVVLKAILPARLTGSAPYGPYSVNKIATSSVNGTTQTATDTVTSVTAATMELTNRDGANQSIGGGALTDANSPVLSLPGTPGTTTRFPLRVSNGGASGTVDSFALSVSTLRPGTGGYPGALPAGYTVVFRDATTNQVISSVDNLAGQGSRDIYADVFVPAGTPGGTVTDLYFRAASPTTGASDDIFDRITVNTSRSVSVKDNNSGQVAPGGSVTYLHTVTNTGNITETNIAINRTGDANGFTSVAYLDADKDGILDPEEQQNPITSIASLAPGESAGVFVKVFGPAQASGVNITTITASLDGDLATAGFQQGGATSSAQDSTTLVLGDVKLDKQQSLDGKTFVRSNLNAAPGATIYYRIVVTNTGTADVTQVVVNDSTPAYTKALSSPAATYTDANGATVVLPTANQPADGASGNYTFNIGTLAPGRSSTINFAVKVDGAPAIP